MRLSWQASNRFDWNKRRWEDGSLLYNQSSGDTHYLDPVSRWIVELLEVKQYSADEIWAVLTSPDAEAVTVLGSKSMLNALIADLQNIGLVESSS